MSYIDKKFLDLFNCKVTVMFQVATFYHFTTETSASCLMMARKYASLSIHFVTVYLATRNFSRSKNDP